MHPLAHKVECEEAVAFELARAMPEAKAQNQFRRLVNCIAIAENRDYEHLAVAPFWTVSDVDEATRNLMAYRWTPHNERTTA